MAADDEARSKDHAATAAPHRAAVAQPPLRRPNAGIIARKIIQTLRPPLAGLPKLSRQNYNGRPRVARSVGLATMPKMVDHLNALSRRLRLTRSAGHVEVDLAFCKATNHDDAPPKEKHVAVLLTAADIRNRASQDYLVGLTHKCVLGETSAVVVTKAVVVLHRLLREGGELFRERFYQGSGFGRLFDHLANFKDDSSTRNMQLSVFLRAYGAFLHQRCRTYSAFAYETEPSRSATLGMDGMIRELPALQKCMDLGMQCALSSFLAIMPEDTLQGKAQHQVLGDVLVFAYHQMKAIPRVCDLFFKGQAEVQPSQARALLACYSESQRLIGALSNLDPEQVGEKWGALELKRPPDAIKEEMRQRVNTLKENDSRALHLSSSTSFSEVDLLL